MKNLIEYIKSDPVEAAFVGVIIAAVIVACCVCYTERELLFGI